MAWISKLESRWRACCLLALILSFLQVHFYFQKCLLFFIPFSHLPPPPTRAILLLLRVTDSLSFWYVCKCYPSFYYTLVIYVLYVLFAISIMINVDGRGYGSHLSSIAICQEPSPKDKHWFQQDYEEPKRELWPRWHILWHIFKQNTTTQVQTIPLRSCVST